MGWVAAASIAISAYGAYSSNQNAQDAQAQQQQAMDRADPFGQQRGEYTSGLRDAVNAGNNPGGYLAGGGSNQSGATWPSTTRSSSGGNQYAPPALSGPGGLNGAPGPGGTGPGGLQYYASGMPAPIQGPDYSNLQNLAGNIQNNPAYQFRMQQGMDNVGRQASSKGMLQSGNYLKDLTDYAQGLASTEYDREYQREFGLSNQRFANQVEGQGQAFRNVTLANQAAQDRFNRYALLTGAQHVMPGAAITAAGQNAFGYNAAAQDNLGRLGGAAVNAYQNYQANQPTSQPQVGQTVQSSAGGY